MGKYSSVSASNLLVAANSALSEISKYNLNNVEADLHNTSNLNSAAGDNLITCLSKISGTKRINGSIPNLEAALKNLKSAAENIIKYQSTEKDIERLERNKYTYDDEGNRIIDSLVVRAINMAQKKLASYEKQIDKLLS